MGSPTFYVKQKFMSFASLRKHVKLYERRINCKLSIKHSRTILSSSLTNINKDLIYYEIQYSCSQVGDSKTIFKPPANEKRATSSCNVECPVKISLRASLDGTTLEVYSFISEHNHEISEEEDRSAEQNAVCVEKYTQNVVIRNYLEKMRERFQLEAAEKKNQLAMTESLIQILKDQVEGFSSTVANSQEDLRQNEDKVIKVHKQLQPEKSLHDELTSEIRQLERRSSTCEDEYNHVVAIRISLNKMMGEYKYDVAEKNKQIAKTESLMESLNEEIEKFDRRKNRFQGDSSRDEDSNPPKKLKVTENSIRGQSTEVNTNPALEDIMQIAAIKRSLEKVEKECKAKENEEPSSDDDSDNIDNAASHSDSDISDSTNSTAVSSENESDTDSEPIAPKPSSSAPTRHAIRPFALITIPKIGPLANQEPVRIVRRPGSMAYITINQKKEKTPEPESSVPGVMPVVTLPRPVVPEVDHIPAENRCDFCHQPFGDPDAALEHCKTHHLQIRTADELHKCHLCPYFNAKLRLLKLHLKRHSRIRKHTRGVPHQCTFCSYSSKRLSLIQKHIRTHTGERPFACDLCQMKFIQSSALIEHKKSIHSKERPFVCPMCCMAFKRNAHVKRHYKTTHLGIKRKK